MSSDSSEDIGYFSCLDLFLLFFLPLHFYCNVSMGDGMSWDMIPLLYNSRFYYLIPVGSVGSWATRQHMPSVVGEGANKCQASG